MKPQLVAPGLSVKVHESFDVRVDDIPSDTEVKWGWDPGLACIQSGVILSCKMDALSGQSAEVVISAEIESLKWSDKATVVIDKTGGKKIRPIGWSPETQKMKEVKRMLDNLKTGLMTEADLVGFFKEMGSNSLNVKEHLVGFKAEVINSFKDPIAGKNFWEAEYGHIERELMFVRREGVVKAWEAAALRYFQEHPDTPFIFKMDVGGWVTEGKEKMRFEGDIDFTIIMFTTDESTTIRDLFASALSEMFGLDMLAIDALATAQRAATSAVYVGPYGADWAEIDAIKRGKIWTIEYFNGKLQTRESTPAEKSLTFAILKNNVQKKLTGKDNLVDLIKEKFEPKPTYDMEPGISLEFMRHIIEDGIHANLAIHEKIIKIAKYLNRSSIDHAQFLAQVPGMT
ncbi:MAG TPA: hypothetical protein VN328_03740, partial [Thermodesulfovibrionales bacterium]|nr:hypothetical protein [Thermodesulfovibrionales bacterium]